MPQSYFTPGPVPSAVVVLAFLGTGLVVAALIAGAAVAFSLGRRRPARWLSVAGAATASAYMSVLAGVSLASEERLLRKGDRKYLCEIDCHLAYSLEQVARESRAGVPVLSATIRTWFDASTIASWRGNAPLAPNPRTVFVLDEDGRRYDPSPAEQEMLEARGTSSPLTRTLRPGDSYTTTFLFQLPESVGRFRLFLGDPPGPELLLIGHENSFFHKKIYFAL